MVQTAEYWSVSLLLFACLARTVSGADTCYSTRTGYSDCWNGCCGPEDDQDCCSSTVLILGLALGGGTVLFVLLLIVFCWACKDCRPKHCCRGEAGDRQRRRGGRHGHHRSHHSRRVVVHPVAPPDYNTATQLRAPSVQPGFHTRNLPQTPPPPYVETVPQPPSAVTRRAAPPPVPSRSQENGNSIHLALQSHMIVVSAPERTNMAHAEGAVAASDASDATSSGVGQSQNSSTASRDSTAPKYNQPRHTGHVDGTRGSNTVTQNRQDVQNVFVVQPAPGPVGVLNSSSRRPPSSNGRLRSVHVLGTLDSAGQEASINVPLPTEPSSSSDSAGAGTLVGGEASHAIVRGSRSGFDRAPDGASQATHAAVSAGESAGASGDLRLRTSIESVEDVDHLYLV